MNTKGLFFGLFTAAVVITPLANSIQPANAHQGKPDGSSSTLITNAFKGKTDGSTLIASYPGQSIEKRINNAIKKSSLSSSDRAAFVKNLAKAAFYSVGGKYNVMVFNLEQPHSDGRLKGVQLYKSQKWGGTTYGIWVFERGTFINKGDGGYINWAFKGSFNRKGNQGKRVVFRKR